MLLDATPADLETIRAWRNHPRVRETHFHMAEITPEQHAGWWQSVVRGERRVLIFRYADRPAGVVHFSQFDPVEGSAHWGFFLDVEGLEATGDLLPAWLEMEREAVDFAFDELKLTWLRGETLIDNAVVRQLHKRFGFTESPVFTREVGGVVHHAITTEMHVANRPRRRA